MKEFSSWLEYFEQYVEQTPNADCVVSQQSRITYKELYNRSRAFAGRLANGGFGGGKILFCRTSQTIEFVATYIATLMCGGVFVPVEKDFSLESLKDLLEVLGGCHTFVGKEGDENVCCEQFIYTKDVLTFDGQLEKVAQMSGDDVAQILFTTGTTGRFKGVQLTSTQLCQCPTLQPVFGYHQNTKLLLIGPLNHFGVLATGINAWTTGGCVYLSQGLTDLLGLFNALNDGVNAIYGTPSAFNILLTLCGEEITSFDKQLEFIKLGGEKCTESCQKTMLQSFPTTRLYIGYGSTESGLLTGYEYSKYGSSPDCVGIPFPNVKIFTLDEDGKVFNATKENPGRLVAITPYHMKGYANDQEKTNEVLKGIYAYTDDLGYIQDGLVHLTGRAGSTIISGGLKVSPYEIENLVQSFDGVKECVCVGKKDAMLGQVVAIYVSGQFEVQELQEFLLNRLESYKVPKYICKQDVLKKNANAKIDRKYYSMEVNNG